MKKIQITLDDLRNVANMLGETMTDEELQEMIERADSNNDKVVSMDDFYNIMTKKTFAWANCSMIPMTMPA